jgi:hypothetical protein
MIAWYNDNESVKAKTLDLMMYHKVKGAWRFEFSNGKNVLACVKATRTPKGVFNRRIMISKYYITHCKDAQTMLDTILHEIAHCIDIDNRGFSNHDKVWKALAQSIGSSGKRCKEDWTTNEVYKYTLMCPVCGAVAHRHRKQEGVYRCTTHKEVIKWVTNY